ncbi:MAG TPA: pyridoxal phosphate-dependent aminotransferase [Acidimicrobiales bacterium]|nr:pyridoxal phosphate-dependent aminotransferase [Acidimicrobiales bacterium]
MTSNRARSLQPSLIRRVAEAAMSRDDVIPLWFGEGCWPTSEIAVNAANASLRAGNHFYQPNSGSPTLRDTIASYHESKYNVPIDRDRITVTASGMQGLTIVAQALVDPGDQCVVVGPTWPNIIEVLRIVGGNVHVRSLQSGESGWHLDVEALLSDITAHTQLVFINSPNNPTGWVMSAGDQQRVLDHCRRTGTWIVADDVYARLAFDADVAPSFAALASVGDQVICVNSFSKAWSMTGWRLGWITAPASLEAPFAMLNEFNIASPAGFIQAAGEAMLRNGEDEVAALRSRLATLRSLVTERLSATPGITYTEPAGAFYAFFGIGGMTDSVQCARELIERCGVGLAPGRAFGAEGEGFLRLCFAQKTDVLEAALDKLCHTVSLLGIDPEDTFPKE